MKYRLSPASSRIAAAAAVCCCCALLAPHADAANPTIQVADGVEFMCGGATRDEAAFLQMVAPRWSAQLEFAVNRAQQGAFPVPVHVKVRDRYNGYRVMEADVTGPTMLTRLDPGVYEVEAAAGGISVVQEVTVINGHATTVRFVFPSNVDFASLAHPKQQALAQMKP